LPEELLAKHWLYLDRHRTTYSGKMWVYFLGFYPGFLSGTFRRPRGVPDLQVKQARLRLRCCQENLFSKDQQ
jgi:hypothetical protein